MTFESRVRGGAPLDRNWIFQLIERARQGAELWPGRWSLDMITAAIEDNRCLVLTEGAAGGFLIYRPPGEAWEIDLVAVSPECRGRGVFRELLNGLAEIALRQSEVDGASVTVWLEVHEANTAATATYLRCGFRVVGRRPDYYADGGAAILMTKDCL